MRQGEILIYWAPLGAMVYFYLTTDTDGRMVFARLGATPEAAGPFWRITPAWMEDQRRAGKIETHPGGLDVETRARIERYDAAIEF